jgi:cystathionine beta-lyase/cystathionine gamma-synthase
VESGYTTPVCRRTRRHERAKTAMQSFGGMLSFEVERGEGRAMRSPRVRLSPAARAWAGSRAFLSTRAHIEWRGEHDAQGLVRVS